MSGACLVGAGFENKGLGREIYMIAAVYLI